MFGTVDVVVRDIQAVTTKAITVGRAAGDYSLYGSLSADGRWDAFGSLASYPSPTTPTGRSTSSVSAADDSDPAPSVTCTPPSGSTFAIGDTTVECTATDAAGNPPVLIEHATPIRTVLVCR